MLANNVFPVGSRCNAGWEEIGASVRT
jgi:hypothetical protein